MKAKFIKKPKLPSYMDRDERSVSKKPSWMLADRESKEKAFAAQKVMAGKDRPPELWIPDGVTKTVRFRDAKEIALIWRYSIQIGGPKGKWRQFTVPEDGATDLFRDVLGAKPSLKAVYEVIDIDGYKDDKTGKRFRNLPRFFVVAQRLHEQLEAIRKKRGGLDTCNIDISRTGQKRETNYSVIPDVPSPMLSDWKAKPRLSLEFEKYYAPLTEEEQEQVVKRVSRRADEDDD
jgi:hypothetical protein